MHKQTQIVNKICAGLLQTTGGKELAKIGSGKEYGFLLYLESYNSFYSMEITFTGVGS
jgi:hypothetical protein